MSLFARIAYFISLIVIGITSVQASSTTSSENGAHNATSGSATHHHATPSSATHAAGSLDEDVIKLRTDWAIAKFQTPKSKQIPEFEQLIQRAQALNEKNPNQPEVMLWYATILSTYSSIKGGLGVLPHVKKARALLEQVIAANGHIDNGLAYGVLGAIYARVPGWPIAFGSKEKAKQYLQQAVQISPEGSDSNFYYGDFLVDAGDYEQARKHLDIAQKAPIRKGYDIQDRGRKTEIAASLAKLQRLGH